MYKLVSSVFWYVGWFFLEFISFEKILNRYMYKVCNGFLILLDKKINNLK